MDGSTFNGKYEAKILKSILSFVLLKSLLESYSNKSINKVNVKISFQLPAFLNFWFARNSL